MVHRVGWTDTHKVRYGVLVCVHNYVCTIMYQQSVLNLSLIKIYRTLKTYQNLETTGLLTLDDHLNFF